MDHFTNRSVMYHAHLHPQWEIYFCPDSLRQTAIVNGVEYTYCHPCVILSKPYTVHAMSSAEPNNEHFERFVFYFDDETVASLGRERLPSEWLEDKHGILFELTEEQAEYLKRILLLASDPAYPVTELEAELLLCLFMHKLSDFCPTDKITKVGPELLYIQEVLRYLSEELSEPLNGDELAKKFAVSRSKLDRDFKKTVGMTVHEFSDVCRLHYAKMLLLSPRGYAVGRVSELCGFKNETYFFAFFRKHTGLSPSEFRKKEKILPPTDSWVGICE
ncbi:MAG: helix-turn-helix transcriptional regulator [Clostridia bacterium]|nr:helix-turn-helix transcriptional regulator [Clostridia bacterium]